jgi:hypothetical protein
MTEEMIIDGKNVQKFFPESKEGNLTGGYRTDADRCDDFSVRTLARIFGTPLI